MKQANVFPECYVDTNLVGHLLGCAVKHKSSCNEVAKAINKADYFAVGVIDADKRPATMDPGFVKHQQGIEPDGFRRHISMYIHEDRKRYFFTIKPAIEKFILDAAKERKVDLVTAGFPANLDELKKSTKRIQAAKDPSLRNLFDLIKDNPEVQRFRNTLKYLVTKQYDADPEVAKMFFDGTFGKDELIQCIDE